NFYDVGLAGDVKRISSAANDISAVKERNEKKFQEAKIAAESADSFIKDMIMAYISGGVAGIKSSIKGKIEDQINSSLAGAFIRATGGSEDQIAFVSDIMSFMRGKMQEKQVKARANTMSMSNPLRSIENMYAKSFNAVNKLSGGIIGTG
ncbi:hypothetical protein, partial [Leptospira ilyithenensis]|uniref:hypothetical protein n=2 Tax=Leptospira ilyithenensis TaxID=2484901 RepID=UPI001438620F